MSTQDKSKSDLTDKEMLGDFDEYPIHQIATTIGHVGSSSPDFADRYYFNAHDKVGGKDFFFIGFGCYPNKRDMHAFIDGIVGGEKIYGFWKRVILNDRHLAKAGPLSFTVIEPYKKWQIKLEENKSDLSFNLEFVARTLPYLFAPMHWEKEGLLVLDQRHMLQSGKLKGTIKIGDKKKGIDDWWSERDHSWGMRIHDEVNLWLWITAQFTDYSVAAWLWEDENGNHVYCGGAVMNESGGEITPFVEFKEDIELEDGTGLRPIKYGKVELIDEKGKTTCLTFKNITSVLPSHLMEFRHDDNIGYGAIEMYNGKVPHKLYFPK